MKEKSPKLPSRQEPIEKRKEFYHGINRHRLSPGEYYLPTGGRTDITVHAARERLLLALIEREPKVLESLEQDVLPAYQAYISSKLAQNEDIECYWLHSANLLVDVPVPDPSIAHLLPDGYAAWYESAQVRQRFETKKYYSFKNTQKDHQTLREYLKFLMSFLSWTIRWNLEYDWFMDRALFALYSREQDLRRPEDEQLGLEIGYQWGNPSCVQGMPYDPEVMIYHSEYGKEENHRISLADKLLKPRHRARPVNPPGRDNREDWKHPTDCHFKFVFRHEGWDPLWQGWTETKSRMIADFKKALDSYESTIRSSLEDKGYKRVPQKYEQSHYEMLALRLVHGYGYEKLGQLFGCDLRTAESAIRDMCQLTQIEPRTVPPGRPKKRRRKKV